MARARGYSTEELTALPLEKHMTQRSLELIRRAISEELERNICKKQGIGIGPRRSNWKSLEKDGSTYFSEITITLLRGNDGSPSGLLGVGRDVTDRKKIESPCSKARTVQANREYADDYIYTVRLKQGMPASTVHGPAVSW